ncbi:alpha/beta hydrolase [Rubinisphaera margarita]|uniref:alpha/beta hydrolase n=1 Tax=Rubinisphaera margarita TaxID=2909586 RepID=UPI001EE78B7A|nr:alpha/beta hydrolase [Rubinisphaera margarita]MCG6155158.1 alpha/beta hydrolase [Rubinisphaera margarita]
MKTLLAFLLTLLILPAGLIRAEDLVTPTTVELWPDGAPAAKGDEPADRPTVTVYQPSVRFDKKCAVIVCPGGGYGGHAMGHEGAEIAGWLNSNRVTAFVLKYRLAPYQHPVPMHDVQRAIRHVRANAKEYGIDPNKVGVLGFSAGGHLASTAVTHFDEGNSEASDPVDQQSCRPDFGILCYPVITMKTPTTHGGSRKNLLGSDPPEDLVELMSNELQVTDKTPPTFLFHTFEDTAVPPLNSVLFYQAMIEHKVPGELHIFQAGRHGVGLGRSIPATNAWSTLAENWMRSNSWID